MGRIVLQLKSAIPALLGKIICNLPGNFKMNVLATFIPVMRSEIHLADHKSIKACLVLHEGF